MLTISLNSQKTGVHFPHHQPNVHDIEILSTIHMGLGFLRRLSAHEIVKFSYIKVQRDGLSLLDGQMICWLGRLFVSP